MSEPRRSDLVSEMYVLVREQAPLHEVTSAVTDVLSDGREVVHGPWEPEECRSVLVPWYDAGWVGLVADADPPWALPEAAWRGRACREASYLVLSLTDARDLLDEPARWLPGTADGHVMLCLTDEGERQGYDAWRAAVDPGVK